MIKRQLLGTILLCSASLLSIHAQTREKGPWWPHPIWGANDQAGGSNWITRGQNSKGLIIGKNG